MIRILLVMSCFVICANAALSEDSFIGAYSEMDGTSCNFDGPTPVWIVHINSPGVTELFFKVDWPVGPWHVYVWAISGAIVSGSIWTGIHVWWDDGCRSGTYIVGDISWGSDEPIPNCTQIGIVAHPDRPSGRIEGLDCNQNTVYITGQYAVVNPVPEECWCDSPVPVEQTTWGQIKALYR